MRQKISLITAALLLAVMLVFAAGCRAGYKEASYDDLMENEEYEYTDVSVSGIVSDVTIDIGTLLCFEMLTDGGTVDINVLDESYEEETIPTLEVGDSITVYGNYTGPVTGMNPSMFADYIEEN